MPLAKPKEATKVDTTNQSTPVGVQTFASRNALIQPLPDTPPATWRPGKTTLTEKND